MSVHSFKRRSPVPPAVTDQPRGRPFGPGQSGNPRGRPRGSRNRATLAAQILLDGQMEGITRKAAEMAQNGDINAIRLCLQHGLPTRREQPIEFELRKLVSIDDGKDAIADVVSAVAAGELTIGEGAAMTSLIEAFVRACRASEELDLAHSRLMNAS